MGEDPARRKRINRSPPVRLNLMVPSDTVHHFCTDFNVSRASHFLTLISGCMYVLLPAVQSPEYKKKLFNSYCWLLQFCQKNAICSCTHAQPAPPPPPPPSTDPPLFGPGEHCMPKQSHNPSRTQWTPLTPTCAAGESQD